MPDLGYWSLVLRAFVPGAHHRVDRGLLHPNVAETIGPAAAVADACLRFHDGPGHPDDHHLHGWLRGGKQLRTGYGLPKPIASVGRLEFGSWRHLHARGGERGREDHAFSCFDLYLIVHASHLPVYCLFYCTCFSMRSASCSWQAVVVKGAGLEIPLFNALLAAHLNL